MLYYLYKYYREINKWKKLPVDKVKELQLRKFAALFEHAKNHSKFYRQLYKDAGVFDLNIRSFDDIKKLPVIDKPMLRKYNIDDITTVDINHPKKFNIRSTSGSTGEPFKIAYNKTEDFTNQARHYWSLKQYGYKPWKKVLIVTRYEPEAMYHYEKDIKPFRLIQKVFPFFQRQIVSVYEPIEQIVEKIRIAKPYILWSTPSMLQIIAYKMKEKGVRFEIPYICFTSETVFEKQAQLFYDILGKNLVNYYGLMESPTIGFDINMQQKFHLFPNSAMFEFIDHRHENGQLLATPVLTNLINYTMPIIKYNTTDIAFVEDDPDFGIKYLGKFIGRLDDVFDFPDGTKFAHHHAHEMFMDFHECQHFKFVQYPDKTIRLQLKVDSKADKKSVYDKAMLRWKKRYSTKELKIEFVEEFPIDTITGKTRNMEKIKK
ncbi:MAG: hypothetical protein K8S00_03665 [Bacteroidales bacterium]|nr:hypothetical protein [Bacteroidales bacterium]